MRLFYLGKRPASWLFSQRLRAFGWLLVLLLAGATPVMAGCNGPAGVAGDGVEAGADYVNTNEAEEAEKARCGPGMCGNLLMDLLGAADWKSFGYPVTKGETTTLALPTKVAMGHQVDYTCQPVVILDPNPDSTKASFHLLEVRDYPGTEVVAADVLPDAFKVPKIGPDAFNKAIRDAKTAGHEAIKAICQKR